MKRERRRNEMMDLRSDGGMVWRSGFKCMECSSDPPQDDKKQCILLRVFTTKANL